ncbi:hypothetical protein JNW88_12010 [Micromonospora sp. ATA32]|nr:hypothetical protein [Micromonospora sp. ATA32]
MEIDELLDNREYYSKIGAWPPTPSGIKPKAWLTNFEESEREHALFLLDSFVYLNAAITNKLFASAFQGISEEVTRGGDTYHERKLLWKRFRDEVLITYPTGERPNVTDSGYLFARKARQLLNIDEDQIESPENVVEIIRRQSHRPVLFVDDFVGSGDQFVATWERQYEMRDGEHASFSSESKSGSLTSVWYCPAVCTELGSQKVLEKASVVQLRPAHFLPARYGALHPETVLFAPHLIPTARDFIVNASRRAGVPPDWTFGYKGLALAIAFEHSVPDATLPLFWVDTPRWKPLLRRR